MSDADKTEALKAEENWLQQRLEAIHEQLKNAEEKE